MHFRGLYIHVFLLCSHYFPFQHLNKQLTTIYLIPLFAMVSALQTPFPFTSNGTPLYVATHWSLVWRSGWICSQIFFLGLSSFSGSPVSKQRITQQHTTHKKQQGALCEHTLVRAHIESLYKFLRERNITCESQNKSFNFNQGPLRICLQIISQNDGLSEEKVL